MIQKLEDLIRAGKFEEVERNLKEIPLNKISRESALAYANIARRIGDYKTSLRILNPIVRATLPLKQPATAPEKMEYAESLSRLGATNEALQILRAIDAKKFPQANFHLALCLFSQWEYADAIPLLETYIGEIEDPYRLLVGKVNLVAAWISNSQYNKARELLVSILDETEKKNLSLLHGNCLELAAQLEVISGNWAQALSYLEVAGQRLRQSSDSWDSLFIKKWKAIADSLKSGQVSQSLLEVRRQAHDLFHAETLRDCDYYIAKITGNADLLTHLYFGTPYESYRKRILECLPKATQMPTEYYWSSEKMKQPKFIFDLTQARFVDREIELRPGQALHRLMILLCGDFYKPVPLVSIFSQMFPDEYYNPDSSPNRVYLIINRLRNWLKQNLLPMEVGERNGTYYLRLVGGSAIRVSLKCLPTSKRELELLKLSNCLNGRDFSSTQVRELLDSSKGSVHRLLTWAVESGKVQVIGRGRRRRYKFAA